MKFYVIFDLDGVIVDNGEYHFLAWKQFCGYNKISFSRENFRKKYFGGMNEEVLPRLFGRNLSKEELKKYGDEKEQFYREIYQPFLKPASGLIPFLDELKKNRIHIAVATSASPENVDFVLNGLKIKNYFDVIVDDSMVSKGKPDPEIYLKAAKLLNAKPANCVVFEDSISGTKSASLAGTNVVGLTTSLKVFEHKYANHIISSFSEISFNFILQKFFN